MAEKLQKKMKLNDENEKITNSQNQEPSSEEDDINNLKNQIKNVQQNLIIQGKDCPYLSTIKKHLLDFDFEKLCSISLNNLNVYVCLSCGKYFQGRSKNTHAYTHCLEESHQMFINLHTTQIYCLPDNYEVIDNGLNDIKFNLKPIYTQQLIDKIDKNHLYQRAVTGNEFIPGFVGMNNLKCTDYMNVMIQAFCRVGQLRNYFLFLEDQQTDIFDINTILLHRFKDLIRKIWNPKNFKGHVSPHELMQAISLKSKKKFQIGQQSDPIELIQWFLNNLEREIINQKKQKDIIDFSFRGEIEVYTYKPLTQQIGYESIPQIERKPFLFLTLDIPAFPLYKEDNEKMSIPHIPIYELLKKYDGVTRNDNPRYRKTYRLKKLPKYMIIHLKRFIQNNFYMEKNPTIVSFPLVNLDLRHYINQDQEYNENQSYKYQLIANICHEGNNKAGIYKIHVKNAALNQWFEIQDLHITEIMPQLVSLSEAYIQIWEKME